MSHTKGHPPRGAPPIGGAAGGARPVGAHRSGRPTFDDRGNAVWEWQTEEGDFSREVNTQRLKKLEAHELSIEETSRLKKLDLKAPKEGMMPGGGFNPYDRGTRQDNKDVPFGTKPQQPKPVAQSIQSKHAQPARKPVKDLKRLQEWMEMKKRLADQKDED